MRAPCSITEGIASLTGQELLLQVLMVSILCLPTGRSGIPGTAETTCTTTTRRQNSLPGRSPSSRVLVALRRPRHVTSTAVIDLLIGLRKDQMKGGLRGPDETTSLVLPLGNKSRSDHPRRRSTKAPHTTPVITGPRTPSLMPPTRVLHVGCRTPRWGRPVRCPLLVKAVARHGQ